MFSDLNELKAILDIHPDNTAENLKLNFINEWASAWLEELLNRKLFLQQRTEYYGGTGTQKLLLRSRPAYYDANHLIQCYVDETGYFGSRSGAFDPTSTVLVYGQDFALTIDQDDGIRSRSAILVRIGNYWPKPFNRQRGNLSSFVGPSFGNVKVIYYGGYTYDNFPPQLRAAANLLCARMRVILPLGVETSSEGYEERSISVVTSEKMKLMTLVAPMLYGHRNWVFS